jgi:type II secretory pathway component GspD/PulD (secretin)
LKGRIGVKMRSRILKASYFHLPKQGDLRLAAPLALSFAILIATGVPSSIVFSQEFIELDASERIEATELAPLEDPQVEETPAVLEGSEIPTTETAPPETSIPEMTIPQVLLPEEIVPETTSPESTDPDSPESTDPEEFDPLDFLDLDDEDDTSEPEEQLPLVRPADPELGAEGYPLREPVESMKFIFRYQPWRDVIEWYADQAGLSFELETAPIGTFNYMDDREYTPTEALDVLNSVLITRGYILVRQNRLLMLLNLEDGIPPGFIVTISVEELADRGKYEISRCLFNLEHAEAELVATEIQDMIGPYGTVVVMPTSSQIMITELGGQLRSIQQVIERLERTDPDEEAGGTLEIVVLEYVMADEVLPILRQLMSIPEDSNASPEGAFKFAVDPMGTRFWLIGDEVLRTRAKEIIEQVDIPPVEDEVYGVDDIPQLQVYHIQTADPNSVMAVLQTMLVEFPDTRLSLDPQTNAIVVLGRPSVHATVKATIDQMENAYRVEIIVLSYLDPITAVNSIETFFDLGGEEASADGPIVEADILANHLIVRGTDLQIEEIYTLLEKMGETDFGASSGDPRTVRTIQMDGPTAEAILEQIQEVWPTIRPNTIRVVNPSAVSPERRSSDPTRNPYERPAPQDNERPRSGYGEGRQGYGEGRQGYGEGRQGYGEDSQPPQGYAPGADPYSSQVPDEILNAFGQPGDTRQPTPEPETPSIPSDPPADSTPPDAFPPVEARTWTPQWASPSQVVYASMQSVQADETEAASPQESGAWIPADQLPPTTGTDQQVQTPAQVPLAEPVPLQPVQPPVPEGEAPGIVVSIGPGGLMIASEDTEALDALEDLIRMLSSGSMVGGARLTVYYLENASAEVVAATLSELFNGLSTASAPLDSSLGMLNDLLDNTGIEATGTIKITTEPRLNAMLVQANAVDQRTIEELLPILDQASGPQDVSIEPSPRLVPVYYTQASEIANTVQQIYADRMAGARGSQPQQQQQNGAEAMMAMMRARGGGDNGGGGGRGEEAEEEPQTMTIGVEPISNSVIVFAPELLYNEVEQFIIMLDEIARESDEVMELIPIQRTNATLLQEVLSSLAGDSVEFNASSSSSRSQPGSSTRPTTQPSGGTNSMDAIRQQMIQRMQSGGFSGRPPGSGGGPGGGFGGRPSSGGAPSGGRR